MPHRTRRRPGITRVSLRLVILLILGAAVLAAAGCGDDDALSPADPDRGIAGSWVRYQPVPPYTRATPAERFMAVTYRDTIELGADGRGRWSFEVAMGDEAPARVASQVVLDVQPPFIFLNDLGCLGCGAPAGDRARIADPPPAPRRESRVAPPHYGIVRDGRDRFELRAVHDPASVQYFRRVGPTVGTE